MAINILDLFKNQVVGELAKSASGFLGESESSTKGVLESVAPAILGSLIQKEAHNQVHQAYSICLQKQLW